MASTDRATKRVHDKIDAAAAEEEAPVAGPSKFGREIESEDESGSADSDDDEGDFGDSAVEDEEDEDDDEDAEIRQANEDAQTRPKKSGLLVQSIHAMLSWLRQRCLHRAKACATITSLRVSPLLARCRSSAHKTPATPASPSLVRSARAQSPESTASVSTRAARARARLGRHRRMDAPAQCAVLAVGEPR